MLRALRNATKWVSRKSTRARSSHLRIDPEKLRRSLEDNLLERVTYLGDLSSGTSYITKLVTTERGRYVLKIPRHKDASVLAFRQQFAFRALQGRLPIPTIRLATEQFVLEDYIFGRNLDKVSLQKAQEKHVFTLLGKYLKTIHQTKTTGFGAIGVDGKGQFATLRLYSRVSTWLTRLAGLNLISAQEYNHLIEYLNKYDFHLNSVETVMLHNDYEDHNIKVRNGGVSGLLDFADLSSGPRALDLARPFIAHYGTDRISYILDGYGYANTKEIEYYAVLRMIQIIPLLVRSKEHKKVLQRLKVLRTVILGAG